MITRQHAKAAGVDWQRLVQCELGGEIGDAAAIHERRALLPPRVRLAARFVESEDRLVVRVQERGVAGGRGQLLRGNALEHPHRVVGSRAPQLVLKAAKDFARALVPAPPQVEGEFVQAMNARRQRRRGCESFLGHYVISDLVIG